MKKKSAQKVNTATVLTETILFTFKHKLEFLIATTLFALTYIPLATYLEGLKKLYHLSVFSYHGLGILGNTGLSFLFFTTLAITYKHVKLLAKRQNRLQLKLTTITTKKILVWNFCIALLDGVINHLAVALTAVTNDFISVDRLYSSEVTIDLTNPKGLAEAIIASIVVKTTRDEIQKFFPFITRENAFLFLVLSLILIILSWFVRYILAFVSLERFNKKGILESIGGGVEKLLSHAKLILGSDILLQISTGLIFLTALTIIHLFVTQDYMTDLINAISYVTIILRAYLFSILFEKIQDEN